MVAADVLGGKPDELGVAPRDVRLLLGVQPVALQQRGRQHVVRKLQRPVKPLVRALAGANLAKVVGRGGVRRRHAQVVQVLALEGLHPVEDGGKHRDAGDLHVPLAQKAHQHGVAHRAVRLAKQVDGARPAAVLLKPRRDGAAERVRVAVYAKHLARVRVGRQAREPGAQRVQKHQVGLAQQRVRVVLHLDGVRQVAHAVRLHAARAHAAKVDGHARTAGAAVVAEGHGARRARASRLVKRHVGQAEHLAHEPARVGAHVQVRRRAGVLDLLARGLVGAVPRQACRRGLRARARLIGGDGHERLRHLGPRLPGGRLVLALLCHARIPFVVAGAWPAGCRLRRQVYPARRCMQADGSFTACSPRP